MVVTGKAVQKCLRLTNRKHVMLKEVGDVWTV